MDFACKTTESAKQQVEADFKALENLLKATPVDAAAITQQFKDLEIEIERYFQRQISYLEQLVKNGKGAEFDLQEAESASVRKRWNAVVTATAQIVGASQATSGTTSSTTPTPTDTYHVKVPKRELAKFSGDVRQWSSFWASFQEIDNDKAIPTIEKYNYLLQSMPVGSISRRVVESFPPGANSYEEAKKELECRFGRKKTLVKVYVRDLLNLVVENARDKKSYNFVDVITSLQAQILNLEHLGVTPDKYGELLYPIVECCVPVEVLNRYLELPGVKEELPEIMDFLRKEVRRKEESARAQSAFTSKNNSDDDKQKGRAYPETEKIPTAASFFNAAEKNRCGFCGNSHYTTDCRKAMTMTMEERKRVIRKSNNCFKCLQPGHPARRCYANIRCENCQQGHHSLMCTTPNNEAPSQVRVDQINASPQFYDYGFPATSYQPQRRETTERGNTTTENWAFGPGTSCTPATAPKGNPRVDMSNYIQKAEVLMQTHQAILHSPKGPIKIRIMHDSGSQSSYIRQSLAVVLGYQPEGKEKVVHQTFGGVLSQEMEHQVVRVEISGFNAPYDQHFTFQASMVSKIAEKIIATPSGTWIQECMQRGIPITDVQAAATDIDILIGNDVSPYLKVGMKSVKLSSGIIATETRLGWMLEGRIPGSEKKSSNKAMVCINLQITDIDVSNYWALEAIGIRDAADNKSRMELEEAALAHFQQTVKRHDYGRYEVHLPYIEGHPTLPDNRGLAYRRLEKTTKDLVRDGYLHQYHQIFLEWEKDGIIERVPTNQRPQNMVHYLGHRAVFKEGSTTPVRPVFNGSARTRLHPALNDCVEKGPNLMEIIPKILSLFRLNNIGVVADIRKAFLQLAVTAQHRDVLRFLWWEDVQQQKKVLEYRHCRVVFGVSSSPFLLGAAIKDLLQQNEDKYPETVAILRNSFYVDNCVTSLSNLEEAVKFQQESQKIFLSAQMDLRGWEYGPTADGKSVAVLGLHWDTGTDMLFYEVDKILKRMDLPPTRRTCLILANSLYDPLGLISPFVIGIKMIFRKICLHESKLSWDAALPEDIQKELELWKSQLPALKSLRIPRCITNGSSRQQWSLHVMCDASKEAYACCIFLRVTGVLVQVQLIQARARVTPAVAVTIPRAELLGCLIAARLYREVVEDLKLQDVPVTFWSDSTTALTWIQNIESVWATFVNRRVQEIRNLTDISRWRHVPGHLNPADYPSRGISMQKFMELRWWEGPDWLRGPESSFPVSSPEVDDSLVGQERKKSVVSFVFLNKKPHLFDQLERLGDWHKILRCLVYWSRFVRMKFMKRCITSPSKAPTSEELQQAEMVLFRYIQSIAFNNAKSLTKLQLQKNEDGLLRVVTKLVDCDDASNFQLPVLLPGNAALIRLMIMKEHSLASHGGVQYLMSKLRDNYWILNLRRSVKSVVNKCAVCRVHLARRCQVVEAPLPRNRITCTHSFDVTGVDLAGPLILKNGEKVWIVLFTCAVYRAVHLELVASLTTEAFLQILRKFIARRGRPSTIYSDNGTNFVGAQNLFLSLEWEKVKEYAAVNRINWIFNPPTAAWWGGWWERLVGLMKQLLRRVLGSRAVCYKELEVLLLEVEAVLNERPLTYVSEDATDLRPLTPSMFLRDLPVACVPEADVAEGEGLRRNLKHVQRLREELRSRFRKEYLSQLVNCGKVKTSDSLNPGDVVLVEADNRKRIEWPMGIVLDVIKGRDGKCRTARLRTTHGEITRPFQRLFLLEAKGSMPNFDPPRQMEEESIAGEGESEEDSDILEEMNRVEPDEPIIITRGGRRVKKPDRLGFK